MRKAQELISVLRSRIEQLDADINDLEPEYVYTGPDCDDWPSE